MYERKYNADYSLCDAKGNLSLKSIMEITQDSCAACFGELGCDNLTLKNKYDSMWVFLKYKAYFYKDVLWNDPFTVHTYIISYKKLKVILETDFLDMEGTVLDRVFLECCVLDCKSHALKRIDSVSFPMDYKCPSGSFFEFKGKSEEGMEEYAHHTVLSQEIDFSHHMNNAAYITMILNTYRVEELLKKNIRSLEIYYSSEIMEGASLTIFKKSVLGEDTFLVFYEGKEAFYMSMEYGVLE